YKIEELCLNNFYGRFFESKSKEFDNYITWNTEKGCFYIVSTLDRDVLIKIAESIR
ncbi:MAG: DUF4367 domain-containing protein, partial [Lachnospiraceae bacterium]|nr:DUF4367 domain-containing protein [Lachnospiraceae bacterium]